MADPQKPKPLPAVQAAHDLVLDHLRRNLDVAPTPADVTAVSRRTPATAAETGRAIMQGLGEAGVEAVFSPFTLAQTAAEPPPAAPSPVLKPFAAITNIATAPVRALARGVAENPFAERMLQHREAELNQLQEFWQGTVDPEARLAANLVGGTAVAAVTPGTVAHYGRAIQKFPVQARRFAFRAIDAIESGDVGLLDRFLATKHGFYHGTTNPLSILTEGPGAVRLRAGPPSGATVSRTADEAGRAILRVTSEPTTALSHNMGAPDMLLRVKLTPEAYAARRTLRTSQDLVRLEREISSTMRKARGSPLYGPYAHMPSEAVEATAEVMARSPVVDFRRVNQARSILHARDLEVQRRLRNLGVPEHKLPFDRRARRFLLSEIPSERETGGLQATHHFYALSMAGNEKQLAIQHADAISEIVGTVLGERVGGKYQLPKHVFGRPFYKEHDFARVKLEGGQPVRLELLPASEKATPQIQRRIREIHNDLTDRMARLGWAPQGKNVYVRPPEPPYVPEEHLPEPHGVRTLSPMEATGGTVHHMTSKDVGEMLNKYATGFPRGPLVHPERQIGPNLAEHIGMFQELLPDMTQAEINDMARHLHPDMMYVFNPDLELPRIETRKIESVINRRFRNELLRNDKMPAYMIKNIGRNFEALRPRALLARLNKVSKKE